MSYRRTAILLLNLTVENFALPLRHFTSRKETPIHAERRKMGPRGGLDFFREKYIFFLPLMGIET
jgi:hypothetical protein